MEDLHVTNVADLLTPLPVIKVNLMRAGIFPGCGKDCYFCLNIRADCPLLKSGIQRLMDTQEILFQKTLVDTITHVTPATFDTPTNDIAIITIFYDLSKTCKRPVKITPDPKFVPLKITMPGPVPYKSNKTIPWNYGGEIFYHGIKQIESVQENSDDETPDIGNIAGTSKITRSGRIFSPEIAPPRAVFRPSKASVPIKPSM